MDKIFIADIEIRLDKFLANSLEETRNQIENLIKKGFVKVDGKIVSKTGYKLKLNQNIEVILPEAEISKPKEIVWHKDIDIIYEDDSILVINKPSGLTVHDAPSVKDSTLVDWLKLKNISLSTISGEERHGIVHRLDKGTSGAMVVAKTNEAHLKLSNQLQDKSMGRYYLAVIDLPLKENTIIEKPIGRNPNNRLKMAVVPNGKYAKSAFSKIQISKNSKYELIGAKLYTGRTHQIRVHLNSFDRHILGDTLYGFKGNLDRFKRVYLHAYSLYLIHPKSNKKMSFTAALPCDMSEFIQNNFEIGQINEKLDQDWLISTFNTFC